MRFQDMQDLAAAAAEERTWDIGREYIVEVALVAYDGLTEDEDALAKQVAFAVNKMVERAYVIGATVRPAEIVPLPPEAVIKEVKQP